MNEEEKKAIDMLNKFRLEHKIFNIRQADNLEENIKIVLNLIEILQRENEELKLDLHEMTISNEHKKKEWVHKAILNSYISKQKIKDKIEELKLLDFGTNLVSQSTANLTTICILQRLLESEEE